MPIQINPVRALPFCINLPSMHVASKQSLPSGFPTRCQYALFFSPSACRLSLSLISFFLLLSPCECLTMSTNCEASYCITFSIHLLLPLVHTQTSSLILRLGLYPFLNSVSISVAYGFGQLIFVKVLMHKNKADGSYKP